MLANLTVREQSGSTRWCERGGPLRKPHFAARVPERVFPPAFARANTRRKQKGIEEVTPEYLARLEKAARSLPRGFTRKVIGRMKSNIEGVIDAGGFHAKND